MSYLKISLIVIFALFVSTFLLNISGSKTAAQPELLKPQAEAVQIDVVQRFTDTLLDYDNPEPSWTYTDKFGTALQPQVQGQAAALVDITTNKLLFEKDADTKRKIASLTKIMTAVIVLEHKKLTDHVTVDYESATVGENVMGISTGDVYTVEELMYGLLLNSGNDSAMSLAKATAGDVPTFVEWMNYKAKELGLTNTYYADPSGLSDDTYSTSLDLVKLTRYAMKNTTFRKFVKTSIMELYGETHPYLKLVNQTNLLTSYPGVEGVKTGYTEEAGLCLVTYANNGGHELIGVVLNSPDRKGDMILMLDHGFATVGVPIEHHLFDY